MTKTCLRSGGLRFGGHCHRHRNEPASAVTRCGPLPNAGYLVLKGGRTLRLALPQVVYT